MEAVRLRSGAAGSKHRELTEGAQQAQEGGEKRRRNELVQLQKWAQALWEKEKVFEASAPGPGEEWQGEKFFGTFPYPYMNGLLHLGHAFSISKLEFACAFHRLCGRRVLFPQGFHCTGMPIKASADKLDAELREFGCPPVFPAPAADPAEEEAAKEAAAAEKDPAKFKGKKSKVVAKTGPATRQWAILQLSGVPEADIPAFRDADHWLRHFPPLAQRDLAALGCGVDWRRSFITTPANPYYDAFVRWQFNLLRAQGRIVKDRRLAIYSPKDGQPCADHDRQTGEGAVPQEYTLLLMRALELPGPLAPLQELAPQGTFLVAATLRPETMYGQTNCWALPEGAYGAYKAPGGRAYIMVPRAARNLSYQDGLLPEGAPERLLEVRGQDLMGLPLEAPLASQAAPVRVLPLLTILMGKGTGIVTSVPSDSPDDYTALGELQRKAPLRAKYGIRDEWVAGLAAVPVVQIPGYGPCAAEDVCRRLKITSQNDAKNLAEAKKEVYLKGFTEGVMSAGRYKGTKVAEAKERIRGDLVRAGQALLYSEPDKPVTSRSGDECVVALTDQWYLTYGEEEWRAATTACLEAMETYSPECRGGFEYCLGWLHQWACSRSYGLGTALPWDPQYLVESLSDSTIYMAFYAVAHILQRGDLYGAPGGPVPAEAMTDEVWSHIFLDGEAPAGCGVPPGALEEMRREFRFWYPMDLRVSGKDLINNHLTFCLYTHTAVWAGRPELWPRAVRCNGHLLLNSQKMSKSTGNFLTLRAAVELFGADAVRMALADAGDGMDDANFVEKTADAAILRLTKELGWVKEVLEAREALEGGRPQLLLRQGPRSFPDRVFENSVNAAAAATREAYERLEFRNALKAGCYDLQNARDIYRKACHDGLHADVLMHYIEVSTLLLVPLCPHICEHVWRDVLRRPGSALIAGWPRAPAPDPGLAAAAAYLEATIVALRARKGKAGGGGKAKGGAKPPPKAISGVDVYVKRQYDLWRATVLRHLAGLYASNGTSKGPAPPYDMEALLAAVAAEGHSDPANKKAKGLVLGFAKLHWEAAHAGQGQQAFSLSLGFDEAAVLRENAEYIQRTLPIERVGVHELGEPAAAQAVAAAQGEEAVRNCTPGDPVALFS